MRFPFFCSFIFIPAFLTAQDFIFKRDSVRIEAKVLEINSYRVKYKLFNSNDTNLYSLAKENIVLIVYENGSYDMFSVRQSKPVRETKFDSLILNYGKNLISMNLFELLSGNVSISYERLICKGIAGVKVPAVFPRSDNGFEGLGKFNKSWATGFDINIYPHRQGNIRYFISASFETGQYRYRYINFFGEKITDYRDYILFMVNNGLLFHITGNLIASLVCGVGIRDMEIYSRGSDPAIKFYFNMGYRF